MYGRIMMKMLPVVEPLHYIQIICSDIRFSEYSHRVFIGCLWFGECFGVFESQTSHPQSAEYFNCTDWVMCWIGSFDGVCLSLCQALEWIEEAGEVYLSTHTSPGDSVEKTQELLREYEEFRISAKVQRHKHFPSPLSILFHISL